MELKMNEKFDWEKRIKKFRKVKVTFTIAGNLMQELRSLIQKYPINLSELVEENLLSILQSLKIHDKEVSEKNKSSSE